MTIVIQELAENPVGRVLRSWGSGNIFAGDCSIQTTNHNSDERLW
jgi:hypothetical protein